MVWTHVITDPSLIAAAGQASVDMLQNLRGFGGVETGVIKRVIGSAWVRPTDASAESEGVLGITYTEADAEAASAVADPATDTLARWRYWKRFIVGTQATGELGRGAFTEFAFDLKMNQRIANIADAFNFIAESDDGTDGFVFSLGVRLLIQR